MRGSVRPPDTDFLLIIPWWSHCFGLPPSKTILCITPWWVFIFDLIISTNKCKIPLQGNQEICYRIRKSQGNLMFFGKSQEKVNEEDYYPCKFLTLKKICACRNVCSWIVYDNQLYIWCYYLHLVLRWFNIANPFYFNLSEVFFNLDQERKLHAINCFLFFAKAFISSLISEQ